MNTFSFIDSNDRSHLFSGKIGSSSWKEKMEIKSNTYIVFNIRTNKDLKLNSLFYLKFTVRAIGFDQLSKNVLFRDLTESLTCLFGSHLSRSYSERFNMNELGVSTKQESILERKLSKIDETSAATEDNQLVSGCQNLMLCGYQHQLSVQSSTLAIGGSINTHKNKLLDLNSSFYRTLLRGGFNDLNKSLYETASSDYDLSKSNPDSTEDIELLKLLNKMTNFFEVIANGLGEEDDAKEVRSFLKLYEKNFESNAMAVSYAKSKMGGLSITELIMRIFAVLIWHHPAIKYQDLFNAENEFKRNEHVAHALKAAESTRVFIIEQQQLFKIKRSNSTGNNSESGSKKASLIDILNEKVLYSLGL